MNQSSNHVAIDFPTRFCYVGQIDGLSDNRRC